MDRSRRPHFLYFLISPVYCSAACSSGLGGARTLLCGSSDRRYTVSATSPFVWNSIEIGTKKPGVTFWGNTGFANVASLVLSKLGQPRVTSDVDADLNGHRRAYSRLVTRHNSRIH